MDSLGKPITRKLSATGLRLIKDEEAFRSRAYVCPGGELTIGYGHVILPGEPYATVTLSEEAAAELLRRDVERAEAAVNSLVKVPLTQSQFDALVSFTFNLGGGRLRNSTLLKRLNEGEYTAAARQFGRWVFADGRRLDGLVKRRERERKLFMRPDEPLTDPRPKWAAALRDLAREIDEAGGDA